METITTFKRIKEIIEPIPADQFCAGVFQNRDGQCCFIGHIQKHISGDAGGDNVGFGAVILTKKFLCEKHGLLNASVFNVNDKVDVNTYTEPIIKDRLMHMIEDGIQWEESKLNSVNK